MHFKFPCSALIFGSGLFFSDPDPALAATHETVMDLTLKIRWMLSDGGSGVFLGNGDELLRIDSAGGVQYLPPPIFRSYDGPSLPGEYHATPDGKLWYWEGGRRIFRYASPHGWEKTDLALPEQDFSGCRLTAMDAGAPRISCYGPDSAGSAGLGLSAAIDWPGLSAWETVPLPPPVPGNPDASLWAQSHESVDAAGLFLESGNQKNWRDAVFTLGKVSDPVSRRDTMPFPRGWPGPGTYFADSLFAKPRVFLVSQPNQTWISLGELLVLRKKPDWSFFYSRKYQPASEHPDSFWRHLGGGIPYFYTGYLVYAAVRSGPGWGGEAGWALGGICTGVGGLALYVNMVEDACQGPDCRLKSILDRPMITLPLVLTLPIVGGILAVASTETHSRRERFWLRAGSSAVGALSGISLYKLFPAGTGLMVIGALAGGSFGVVVGYRLAWVP